MNDVIASVAGQTIINSCYDLPSLDSVFCDAFKRNGATLGPADEAPGAPLRGSLLIAPFNFASRIREGFDVDVSYRRSFGRDISLNTRLIYSHVIKSSNFQDPPNPEFENRIVGELGDPQDQFVFDADLTVGEVTFGYGARYVGRQLTTTYEAQNSLNGEPPQNPDQLNILEYPDVLYHDFRISWQLKKEAPGKAGFEFYVGADNVFDRHPPLGLFGTGDGSAIFDPLGRRFYAGARARF